MKTLALSRSRGLRALALCSAGVLGALVVAGGVARAETTIVVDVESGKVLSQKGATERWYPASTTKLLTAYVALKALETGKATLDTPVVMTRFAASQAPSKMGFEPGSVIRLDNALRMMLVKSANDVAVAIAQSLGGGSIETFLGMMNSQAAELGMRDSWFVNPNGLPGPGQYSSAKDLAILGMRLRRDFPAFSEIFGVEAISTGTQTLQNTNGLLGRYRGADGMKTGYICASGFNIVASATRDGRTLVAVVLGADGPIVRDRITADILEKGFAADPVKSPATIDKLPISAGPPADISREICSPEGQTARAKERQLEAQRGNNSGSPYLTDMTRPATVVAVGLGGAAASETVEAGISQIAAYGIPLPRWRPEQPAGVEPAEAGPARAPSVLPEAAEASDPVDGAKGAETSPASDKSARVTFSSDTDEGSEGLRGGVTN